MKLKRIKVYHLFWLVAIIVLLIGICNPDETLDINVHDTYFVIAHLHAAIITFLFFFLNGFGYWFVQNILKKQLEKSLTFLHTFIVIGSFIVYWMVIFYNVLFPLNFPLSTDYQLINIISNFNILLNIFVAFPVYITNLLITIFNLRNTN